MIQQNFEIPNTLGVKAQAELGCKVASGEDLREARSAALAAGLEVVYVGEGSNIVPAPAVHKLVCLLDMRGIDVVEENAVHVVLQVGASENWHQLVLYCLERNWYGLENLALIPGSVGAAPVQNIGAYGRELATFVTSVTTMDLTGTQHVFSRAECEFAYRDSVFKRRRDLLITHVRLKLSKVAQLEYAYPQLAQATREQLAIAQANEPDPQTIARAVMQIRQAKLPDPASMPNVGSFFKNPVVDSADLSRLQNCIANLQFYPLDGENSPQVKLSAAQLIDQAGWKTRGTSTVACWHLQPLVLVNTGTESALQILEFARAIQADILARYQVELELEPSVLD